MSHIGEVWRYPVKSMGGERISETNVGERGIAGDRAWAIRDETAGAICGAKKIGGLMRLSAAYAEAPDADGSSAATVTLEDGGAVSTGDADVNERLSAALGCPVSLWPLMPPEQAEHYKREKSISAMSDDELRAMFGRAEGEPLPDITMFPPELLDYESPIGTYFDAFPLLIMTTASLATLQTRAPQSRFDVRRFRPNLLVDGVESDAPFPELTWAGKRASIGDAIIFMALPCPRCVMVTRPFAELEKDPNVMRALVRETEGNLGIGAVVVEPGIIREGDTFTLLD